MEKTKEAKQSPTSQVDGIELFKAKVSFLHLLFDPISSVWQDIIKIYYAALVDKKPIVCNEMTINY
jgi:hypothetical protein